MNYAKDAETYAAGSNVTKISIYTNNNATATITNNARNINVLKTNEINSDFNYIDGVMDKKILFTGNNIENIEKYLKEYDNTFNISNYDVEIDNLFEGYYFLTLTEKIGEFVTNSSYKIFVKDNIVASILDDTREIQEEEVNNLLEESKNIQLNKVEIENYKKKALRKSNIESGQKLGDIVEEKVLYTYNCEDKKKEVLIYDIYENELGSREMTLQSFSMEN